MVHCTSLAVALKNPMKEAPSLLKEIMSSPIHIALSKGRILQETLPLLEKAGITPDADLESTRQLVLPTNHSKISLVLLRASDVPTYVRYGAADFGIAGKDILLEQGDEGLYVPLDLGIAPCKMVVARKKDFDYQNASRVGKRLRVATKYPNIARSHFAQKGVHVDIIKLYGSMELAPLVGLSDVIVDLVATGTTLKANQLEAVEEIIPITSFLIMNPAALRLKYSLLQPLLHSFA